GSSRPATRRKTVVLPAPLRPTSPTRSAGFICKVTPRRTSCAPYDFSTLSRRKSMLGRARSSPCADLIQDRRALDARAMQRKDAARLGTSPRRDPVFGGGLLLVCVSRTAPIRAGRRRSVCGGLVLILETRLRLFRLSVARRLVEQSRRPHLHHALRICEYAIGEKVLYRQLVSR